MLLPRSPYPTTRCFNCSTCRRLCNGFIYYCEKCDFHLDVLCSQVPYLFKHVSHEHQLILSKLPIRKRCSCCNSSQSGYKFCCADCEFIVDFKCLTLPDMIRYREHEHPFKLCYTPEDDSSEYYCDICEKNENQSIAHPICIYENFLNVKFEKACTYDIHQHPLTSVQKTEDAPLCKKCGKCRIMLLPPLPTPALGYY
ncbi:hypothetical protein CIPAW_16G079800 [Carya illinoinensis]|uniref:DC1 domain-containing protein n=1 Tax=Carya illinoinensis TaxID=32201 RepID=A0A8T1N840_CARIL|nr:hypothetical protein CIPAW_16G079800 [Carya illinoinensis]